MNNKQKYLKTSACAVKHCRTALASITIHLWETIWAVGTSGAAAMVISTSTHHADA